ncbi:ribonuclease D [Tahibacter amnicola]|uniref:HRDC domain-containing protein n=1 Tax=Tahibacter amnicola TaxID=2976241 RepID=A0ABY6BIG7_9GAMM|nr:HRDC domain-containing protein [Tahibacter amnicola]UXI69799.1 HRDC domain-containing protein [Tahibacter amnicola]
MYHWIDTANALADIGAHATPGSLIGLDTEFMRVDSFYPQLALLQVNLGGHVALIDPLALDGLDGFSATLSDTRNTCIMHSASEDLEALAPSVPGGIGTLFDTQIAAAMAGYGLGLSYQKLVAAITGVDLPKAETRSDWTRRPLSPEQLDYAAQDVIHLPAVHSELEGRLRALGREQWHAEDCRRMLEKSRVRDGDPEPQRHFKSAADWPREQQALLRRILLWREATARRIDKPRPWVLDDARIAEFVLRPPVDVDELFSRSKGLRALRGAQRAELFDVLQAPLEPEELDFAPIFPLPAPREKRILSAMKESVTAIATELDLPEGLLCARRHLEALVFDKRWPDALDGWRKPLLQGSLMSKLA